MRFAFGGIHIECSTYSRTRTRTEDLTVFTGEALSAAPKFAFLSSYRHPFFPTLYASAVPGGPVEQATYETLRARFLQSLKELLPLDGLYLPMHGALDVQGMQDAEGDWITAARQVVGADCAPVPVLLPGERTSTEDQPAKALSDGCVLQDLDKLPRNQSRPPTFPFDRSLVWQPSTLVSCRSPRETL